MEQQTIKVSDIHIDEKQNFRKPPTEEEIQELKQSILAEGLRDPIDVVKRASNAKKPYQLVCGYRRMAAILAMENEDVDEVMAVVYEKKELPGVEGAVRNLQENINRKQLDPITEAEGARFLLHNGKSEEEVCEHFGWTGNTLTRRLALVGYSDELKEAVRENRVGLSQAAAIAELPESSHEKYIGVAEGLSTTKLRQEVAKEAQRLEQLNDPDLFGDDDVDMEEVEEEVEEEIEEEDSPADYAESIQRSFNTVLDHLGFADADHQKNKLILTAIDFTTMPLEDLEQMDSFAYNLATKLAGVEEA